jgi:hypothetical protein
MTGLVSWWPLHENSGDTARDLSGNGRAATVSDGSPVRGVSGKGGLQSTFFTGDDAFAIDIPDMERFTISVWMKHRSGDPDHAAGSGANEPYPRNWDFAPSYFQQDDTQGSGSSSYTISWDHPGGDEWHLVTVTKDNSELKVFIDGSLAASDSKWTSAPLREYDHGAFIGKVHRDYAPNYDATDWYKGGLCDFRIYNRALSPQEIQTLYEWGSGDYTDRNYHDGSDPGAVSRWDFDGDLTDSWGDNGGTDNTSAGFSSDAIRGQAKSFDGDNDNVNLGPTERIHDISGLTLSGWQYIRTFQKNDTGNNEDLLLANHTGSWSEPRFRLGTGTSAPEFLWSIGDDSNANAITAGNPTTENWYHVAGTFDSGDMELYVNGVKIATGSVSLSSTPDFKSETLVADMSKNAHRYSNALIDDIRIYSRALEPHEVFQLYQWGTRGRDMRKLTVNQR